jgi:hypothetical protein
MVPDFAPLFHIERAFTSPPKYTSAPENPVWDVNVPEVFETLPDQPIGVYSRSLLHLTVITSMAPEYLISIVVI